MSDGSPIRPKILRGAFVELGLSLPPPVVVFQFNPVQLTRSRTVSIQVPGAGRGQSARQVHSRPEYADLLELGRQQFVDVGEETIGFDLRLDAADQLDDQDGLTEKLGIAPQLATLDQMVLPKDDSQLATLFGKIGGFSFTRGANPPLVLFVFGRKRVLPVNITSMVVTETDFSATLNPIRASVTVALTVIEGSNLAYRSTKAAAEVMAALNLARAAGLEHVVIPGVMVMFDQLSRYVAVPPVATPDPQGRLLPGTDIRLLPDVTGVLTHSVQQGDRLDLLAQAYYGRPLEWWRICDANPEVLSPLALVGAEPVTTTDVPVTATANTPWSVVLAVLAALPGVAAASVVLDSGARADGAAEDGWAVRVTHNTATTTAAQVVVVIVAAGFALAGPLSELGRIGTTIAVPPPANS